MNREELVQTALFDFLAQWDEDCANGAVRPLAHYLARFPECEFEIAREYVQIVRAPHPDAGTPATPDAEPAPDADFAARRIGNSRYHAIREIARGGMGRILRVRDGALDRDVAMKVSLEERASLRSRLVEEAHVTGELDHPGVVPVHDLGVDANGRSFFTMRLVEGRDLREIIRKVRAGEDGWNLARVLDVLLKVCDTLAYAHSRGVVHRDLKPSNVRVGGFGEVYVMDWGLAKSARRTPTADVGGSALDPRAPSLTLDGDVIGTPCTMSPEQAAGRVHEIGPRSDVYSTGAMLYEILSGETPFVDAGETPTPEVVLARVRSGSPRPLRTLCPKAPPELVAICEKAMARDPLDRYADMREMASDLRAYLELRVVVAHRTGAWVELLKWVKRNRWPSVAIAGILAGGAAVAIVTTVLQHRNAQRLQLLADSRLPKSLADRFSAISPDVPERVAEMDAWLTEANDLIARRAAYKEELDALRLRALPWDQDAPREKEAELTRRSRLAEAERLIAYYQSMEAKLLAEGGLTEERLNLEQVRLRLKSIAAVRTELLDSKPERLTWRFEDHEEQFRHDLLTALQPDLVPLVGTPLAEGLVSVMKRRIEFARSVDRRTRIDAAEAWRAAIASIRDVRACPAYGGLAIEPRSGLVPIRRDPTTGLWEFLHAESGDAPDVGTNGSYVLTSSTGIVLVLVPGGEYEMGAQAERNSGPNYDPAADRAEWTARSGRPETVHVRLDPFFLSKYEMTQAQWRRITGENPSGHTTSTVPQYVTSEVHPVENVTWTRCLQVMQQVGLTLPTEAQWEYAARAGTTTPWWTGSDRASLFGAANLRDRRVRNVLVGIDADASDWSEFDDGYALHAPVGMFRPNGFGLHDVCGNVSEWCRDAGATSYDSSLEVRYGTCERSRNDEGLRVHRGGSNATPASGSRSSARAFNGANAALPDTGLRPSLDLPR